MKNKLTDDQKRMVKKVQLLMDYFYNTEHFNYCKAQGLSDHQLTETINEIKNIRAELNKYNIRPKKYQGLLTIKKRWS